MCALLLYNGYIVLDLQRGKPFYTYFHSTTLHEKKKILLILCLMAESEEELKSLLMKVKEKSEKVGLERNIRSVVFFA